MLKAVRALFGYFRCYAVCDDPTALSCRIMSEYSRFAFDVCCDKDGVYFSVYSYAKRRLFGKLRDEGVATEIVEKRGVLRLCEWALKRSGIIVGMIIISLIIAALENVAFEIRIQGNGDISKEYIRELLRGVGVYEGARIMSDDIRTLENNFILSQDEISWIGINMSGNVAFVEVKKRDGKGDEEGKVSMAGMISDCDCIVDYPVVRKGSAAVKPGDAIYKGQLVISPYIVGKDGAEYLTGAMGEVMAFTEEHFLVTVGKSINEQILMTEEETKSRVLYTAGEALFDKLFDKRKGSYIGARLVGKISFGDDRNLPFSVERYHRIFYRVESKVMSSEEARERAYKKLYSDISRRLENAEILGFEFSENDSEDTFLLTCTVRCKRNVAKGVKE